MIDVNATLRTYAMYITVPVILAVGLGMGQLSNSGYGNDWFDALRKPAAMPPGWTFGAAWTTLYILMGIALALAVRAPSSSTRNWAIGLFLAQLALNYSWSPMFFSLHAVGAALAIILLMLGLTVATTVAFFRIRPLAGWLLLPYIAWLCFAAYLNYDIWRLNPAA